MKQRDTVLTPSEFTGNKRKLREAKQKKKTGKWNEARKIIYEKNMPSDLQRTADKHEVGSHSCAGLDI
jgi:uncharacterized protein YdeI (YjbR/CyaY-like superfamily)